MSRSTNYRLPKYARDILGETGGVAWDKANPLPDYNAYSGLVDDSLHRFSGLTGLASVIFYESKFAIDGDGSGGETPGDTFLPDTSLHFGDGKPLNAHHFPFAVIPIVRQIDHSISFEQTPLKITLGDIGIAFWQQRRTAFIYADRGPKWKKVGEGSINLANNLGIKSDPNEGGIEAREVPPGVIHIVFPGTSDVTNPKDPRTTRTPTQINQIAEEMFLKFVHAL
jgi:Fungal chitosanase of glycosyl hydrolase group 75